MLKISTESENQDDLKPEKIEDVKENGDLEARRCVETEISAAKNEIGN